MRCWLLAFCPLSTHVLFTSSSLFCIWARYIASKRWPLWEMILQGSLVSFRSLHTGQFGLFPLWVSPFLGDPQIRSNWWLSSGFSFKATKRYQLQTRTDPCNPKKRRGFPKTQRQGAPTPFWFRGGFASFGLLSFGLRSLKIRFTFGL